MSRQSRKLSDLAYRLCVPKGVKTTGFPAVEAQCGLMGIEFDEWQRGIGQLALAKRASGLYAAGVGGVVMSIPRQSGKTFLVGWLLFALAILEPGLLIVWTAHHTRTSDETFENFSEMSRRKSVARYVRAVRGGNGKQAVKFTNGSRILFGARESGFGRGFSEIDVLVLDEAQILTENALSDMVPATNASPNGLVFMMGTPPRPKDPGEAFTLKRAEAVAGDDDVLYVEFSAGDDADPSAWSGRVDWKAVERANPSFPHRTSKQSVLRMKKLLANPDSFRREALGIWDKTAAATSAINGAEWNACRVPGVAPEGSRAFAVRFSIDGSHVAVGAASKLDKDTVFVDGVRVEETATGLDWIVDFLTDESRLAVTSQIVVEGKSGAGYLIDRLRAEGVAARVIWTPTVQQAIEAHAMFYQAIKDKTVQHAGGEELDRQAGYAMFRKIGNQGGFGWAPPEGETVALLDAVTLAYWAAKTSKRRPGRRGGIKIL